MRREVHNCSGQWGSDARSLIIINHARPRSWGESFLLYEMDNFYIDMCVHCSTAPSPEINNESQSQKGKGEKKIPRETENNDQCTDLNEKSLDNKVLHNNGHWEHKTKSGCEKISIRWGHEECEVSCRVEPGVQGLEGPWFPQSNMSQTAESKQRYTSLWSGPGRPGDWECPRIPHWAYKYFGWIIKLFSAN